MNERIRELARQAENYAAEQNDKFGVSYKKTYNEKFAELIVGECIAEARDEAQYQSGWAVADLVADRLRKHFGIK